MPIPLNLPNFLNAPILSGRNEQAGNMFSGAINAYQQGQQHQQGMLSKEQQIHADKMKNALMEKYGEREKLAEIAQKEAQAKYWGAGGSRGAGGGGAGGLWRNLPLDTRTDMIAQTSGFGGDPAELAAFINQGGTFEQYKDQKRKEGYDVDTAEKLYPATARNRSDINSVKGYTAELDVLEHLSEEGLEDYNDMFLGYSPTQVADQIKGLNPDKQARFLARRAMQSELAGTRTRILGGSNAQEALKDMQEKSLGNSKIFRSLVSKDVYAKTQKYLNDWIKQGSKARTDVMSGKGYKADKKENLVEKRLKYEQEMKRLEETAGINDLSDEELDRLLESQ
jgi:hypothetical protein